MTQLSKVFGWHAVSALLNQRPEQITSLSVLKGRMDLRMQQLLQQAERHQIPVHWQSRQQLDESVAGRHQGVVAYTQSEQIDNILAEGELLPWLDKQANPLILLLDGVTDPHNLGACLRSADAAGVVAVILPKDNAAGITDTVRKVACGAAESVPIVTVVNLARTMKALQQAGIWLVGTAGEAEQELYDVDLRGPIGLVMGAEAKGLRRLTREHCDYLARLPLLGQVSSLNVSVATGVCLFEAVRQRRVGH